MGSGGAPYPHIRDIVVLVGVKELREFGELKELRELKELKTYVLALISPAASEKTIVFNSF